MSYIPAAARKRAMAAPAPATPIDAFTLPGDIPDTAEAHPAATGARCANASLAPLPQAGGAGGGQVAGIPSENWRARGLAHPAGRGWEVVTPASTAAPAHTASQAAALLADPEEEFSVFTRALQVAFLEALATCGNVRAAARSVGVSYRTAYRARRRDPAFRQAWSGALIAARPVSEDVLATRAIDGVEEIVWFRGEEVGRRTRYDSRLLLAHLARLDKLCEDALGSAIADDFEAALERFVAGEALAAPAPETPVPGQCDRCDKSNSAAPVDGGERGGGEPLVWCPFVREHVDRETATLNEMDAQRPEWVIAPHELDGHDAEEVDCAQLAAYENGEAAWYLALPPEDYETGEAYRIAAREELEREERAVN